MRLLLSLGLLQRRELALGQHQPLLSDLGLQRLQPLLHRLQVMALPDAAHARRRDGMPAGSDLIGNPDLPIGGLFQGNLRDQGLDLRSRAVGQERLASAQLLQRHLATGVVELAKPVEAVARVAHHLTGLADVAELLGKL